MERTHFHCQADAPIDAEIERAFEQARQAQLRSIILVLPPELAVNRELVAPIVAGVHTVATLEELALVHPNALLGFIASSIALQAPRTRIRSASTIAGVE
jgi:hypothetical protein